MKLVILDGYTENPGDLSWESLEALGALTVYDRTPDRDEEIIRRIGDAEIVLTNKTPIRRAVFDACQNLRFLSVLATGYNIVDVACARERGIPVSNVPSYGTQAVAQFAIALLLEICGHVGHHARAVQEGRWARCADYCFWDFPLIELAGKTMGIVGLGRIGKATARIAGALGMEVLASDSFETDEGRAVARYVPLDELYARADVVVLHCPLTPETEQMIDRNAIAKMKDGVILINNSRGALIAEQDLADALDAGKVYAAAVDVVSAEPIRPDNPLLRAKNCIITPHISWAPREARQRIMDCTAENIRAFLAGAPVNVVNP
jgi:glycerate dehydrogenase